MFNDSKYPYEVNFGVRIAQMFFEKYETVKLVKFIGQDGEKLSKGERNSKGFGSFGV